MMHNRPITAVNKHSPKPLLVPVTHLHRAVIDQKIAYLLLKRIIDIIFSLVFMLFILSWLLPLLIILIKLSSRGPVFFMQKRVGFGGKTFTCYKLRTMVVNTEADSRQASESDDRVTRIGQFLRQTNMDEFPQFLNVLKGDMSIVGPRPHMYADCRLFASLQPGYKFRNMVRPGITGLSQVKGYHGPTSTRDSILMRFYWDDQYIRNISLILDCRILFTTVFQRFAELFMYVVHQMMTGRKNKNEVQAG